MSGHSSWKGVRPIQDPTGRSQERQMDYCDGYMLALDDLFKDLNDIEQQRAWDPEARELLRRIRRQMHALRGGAKNTYKILMREAIHERQQGVPAEAGLGEGLRGDLGGLPGQPPLQDTAPE